MKNIYFLNRKMRINNFFAKETFSKEILLNKN